jgi:AraC-like DNA-binding protein
VNKPRHLAFAEWVVPGGVERSLTARHWVLLRLSEGIVYICADRMTQELVLGGALVVPPGLSIRLLASKLGPAVLRGMVVHVGALHGLLTPIERRFLESQAPTQLGPFATLPPAHPLAKTLAEVSQPGLASLSTRLAILQGFSGLIAPHLAMAGSAPAPAVRDAKERLRQCIHQMPESQLASLSLAGLARQVNCCERHAGRLVREVCGGSFRDYVSEVRLKRACQLLLQGHTKILRVAQESGHGSLAVFNHAFKKRFKLTPTQWRSRNAPRERRRSRSLRPQPTAVTA